ALRFWGRIGYDDTYGGIALDENEGARIGRAMEGKEVMFSASHGVTVTGATMAWAFDDLYYLERACMHQGLAMQAASGRPLREIAEEDCRAVATQIAGERAQSDLFFAAIKRRLDHEQPGWRSKS
ncbi:MAG: class II aldolase/adducin family protein, partial [Rhodoferax sp.]|nr:class II aldolase/adducin family protein [Rhodoferax sp.]